MGGRGTALGWIVGLIVAGTLLLGGLPGPGVAAQVTPEARPSAAETPTVPPELDYLDWLQAHQQRQLAVLATVPTTLDLGNAGWRRDLALALDSWGALLQQARDQRPPTSAQAAHRALLDAVDQLDAARRLLLVAAVTGEEPGSEMATGLQRGQQLLLESSDQGRALLLDGRPPPRTPVPARGNLRVTVLGLTRPYAERGAPADAAYEYLVVRLRLESVAGEPVTYDAFQFRLRAADQTVHNPVALGVPDELLYGALEGNRLAGEIVGNVAFPIRTGMAATALFYAVDSSGAPLLIALGAPASAATRAPAPPPTATPGVGATPP